LQNSKFFVLTGAIGGGKSTVIDQLGRIGIECIPEPARQILREQRSVAGKGAPEEDPGLFCQLMLSRAIKFYTDRYSTNHVVVFDRGIPDMIAYAELFGLDTTIYRNAAMQYAYNNNVFYFEGWPEIYKNDDERKIDVRQASDFGMRAIQAYKSLGYEIVKVPKKPVKDRVKFVCMKIIELSVQQD